MGINIFVDDERDPPTAAFEMGTTICRSSTETLSLLARVFSQQNTMISTDVDIDELSLDHDLGGDDTILPIVKFLVVLAQLKHPLRIKNINIHSANPVGVAYMADQLKKYYQVTFRKVEE